MELNKKLERRLARGVKLLDKKIPNWWKKIKLTSFDFSNSCNCIVGQLGNHDYFVGKVNLGIRKHSTRVSHGFDWSGDDNYDDMRYLGDRWKQIIQARRKAK